MQASHVRSLLFVSALGTFAASPAVAGSLACGAVVAAGTSLTLTSNLGPCDNAAGTPAITVESGASLDLNGFAVQCIDAPPAVGGAVGPRGVLPTTGILLTGSGASVTGGTVSGCVSGVRLGGTGKHEVTAITVTDDGGDAVLVDAGSEKNKISNVTVNGASAECFQIEGDKNKLSDCHANGCNDGIEVDGARNKVSNCRASGNNDGFDIDGDANKLLGNESTGNDVGFFLGGANTKVVSNTAVGNGTYGIEVSDSAKISGNTVNGNGGSGIVVRSAPDAKVKVQKNTASDNATVITGFDLEDATDGCGAHGWKKNVFGTASDSCIQ